MSYCDVVLFHHDSVRVIFHFYLREESVLHVRYTAEAAFVVYEGRDMEGDLLWIPSIFFDNYFS